MGVVTKYGAGFKDPSSIYLPKAEFAQGRLRLITTKAIAVANGDSATSVHYLGKIPSNAIIMPAGAILHHDALTGVTDYDIGLFKDGAVAAAGSEDILAASLDIHLAGTKSVVAAVANADLGKTMWELLGLSTDPGVEYDIGGTMNQASTADGVLAAFISYALK